MAEPQSVPKRQRFFLTFELCAQYSRGVMPKNRIYPMRPSFVKRSTARSPSQPPAPGYLSGGWEGEMGGRASQTAIYPMRPCRLSEEKAVRHSLHPSSRGRASRGPTRSSATCTVPATLDCRAGPWPARNDAGDWRGAMILLPLIPAALWRAPGSPADHAARSRIGAAGGRLSGMRSVGGCVKRQASSLRPCLASSQHAHKLQQGSISPVPIAFMLGLWTPALAGVTIVARGER